MPTNNSLSDSEPRDHAGPIRPFACRCLPFAFLAAVLAPVGLSLTGDFTLFEKENHLKSRVEQLTDGNAELAVRSEAKPWNGNGRYLP